MVSQALQEATKHIRLAWVGSDRASLREPLLRWGGHAHARIPKHPDTKAPGDFKKGRYI